MGAVRLAAMRLFHWHRHDAAMRNVALEVLKLNGGVQDVELSPQALFHLAKDSLARRRRNVFDADVAGEGMDLRPNTPDMQIVNVTDARDLCDFARNLVHLHPARHAFEENVKRLADNAEGGP